MWRDIWMSSSKGGPVFAFLVTFLIQRQLAPTEGQLMTDHSCGKTIIRVGGVARNDNRLKSPWTALILVKGPSGSVNDLTDIGLSGIIIGPSTIITGGSQFWKPTAPNSGSGIPRMYTSIHPARYLVAVGLKNRVGLEQDSHSQLLEVDYIRPHPASYVQHSAQDFAIVRLRSSMNFSTMVRPICVEHPAHTAVFTAGRVGASFLTGTTRLSGFRYHSNRNQDLSIAYYNLTQVDVCAGTECQPQSTPAGGPHCKGAGSGSTHIRDRFLPGASLATWHAGRWFLAGMVTKSYECPARAPFLSLITVRENLGWINANIAAPAGQYVCMNEERSRVGQLCDSREECTDGSDEDPEFCEAFKCPAMNTGQAPVVCSKSAPSPSNGTGTGNTGLAQPSLNFVTEPHPGVISTPKPPFTTAGPPKTPSLTGGDKLCMPLPLEEGTKYECITGLGSETAPCYPDQPAPVGARIKISCMPYYKASGSASFYTATCSAAGVWEKSRRRIECTLECGIPKLPDLTTFIVNGVTANSTQWPWNAALFSSVIRGGSWNGAGSTTKGTGSGQDEGRYEYICGATLITADALITAAHCVTTVDGGDVSVETLRVVLAPTRSRVGASGLKTDVQATVKLIAVHGHYNPTTYESDIAIIRLRTPAPISNSVYPVCLPLHGREHEQRTRLQLSEGTLGTVVGFGVDESGSVSPTLKQASVPVVSVRDCNKVLNLIPSTTQICGGHTNGTGVCNGDSGAGLVFQDEGPAGLYYLQGVVSHGPLDESRRKCDARKYAIFTRVASFQAWIEETVFTDKRK